MTDNRYHRREVSFTDEEWAACKVAAAKEGVPLWEWIRRGARIRLEQEEAKQ